MGRRAVLPRAGRRSRSLFLAACGVLAAALVARVRGGLVLGWFSTPGTAVGRRGALAAAAALFGTGAGDSANAFDNALKQIKRDINNPKRKGLQPSGLGLEARNDLGGASGVKECTEKAPNCFSTTGNPGIDTGFHLIEPWQWSGKNRQAVMEDVVKMIKAYPPGQNGIDGGGFDIQVQDSDCVYTQFESLKRGYIDDVEFCIQPGTSADATSGNLLLRSSSRQGYYDYGTNAVRLNKLSEIMSSFGGWKTEMIDKKSHPTYWSINCDGGEGRKAPYSVKERYAEQCTA